MDALRTPDDRFADLPDYSFAPHYVEVPAGAPLFERWARFRDPLPRRRPARRTRSCCCMHGEPSWCFLYRKMIPVLVDAGLRCVAPDLVGFGRSDKPTARTDYTYARHVEWMRSRALRHARPARRHARRPGLGRPHRPAPRRRASRPVRARRRREHVPPDRRPPPGEAFLNWQRFSQTVEEFPVGFIVNIGCTTDLADDVVAGLRRAVPRRDVQGRRAPVPDAGADDSRRPGRGCEPRRVGRCCAASTARS